MERQGKYSKPTDYCGPAIVRAPIGIYDIEWVSGGFSIAVIGVLHDGTKWIATPEAKGNKNPTMKLKHIAAFIKVASVIEFYGDSLFKDQNALSED